MSEYYLEMAHYLCLLNSSSCITYMLQLQRKIDYKATRLWVQQHTLFVNPIHTNTTPWHYTSTYNYFLGKYSVFVCIELLIIEQNNGMMLPKHTYLFTLGEQRKNRNVECHSLLRQKEQLYCFQIHQ